LGSLGVAARRCKNRQSPKDFRRRLRAPPASHLLQPPHRGVGGMFSTLTAPPINVPASPLAVIEKRYDEDKTWDTGKFHPRYKGPPSRACHGRG